MYNYVKAIHIIFIVTWFAGLFYIVRLFIYNAEANEKPEPDKSILQKQFNLMILRLWLGITWPSAILSLIFGSWMLYLYTLYTPITGWLWVKLCFVVGLYLYHFSLHKIYKQQQQGKFTWSSNGLRIWNEVATIFLISIVLLVVVKQGISFVWGLLGLVLLMLIFIAAIKIYRLVRNSSLKK